MLTYRNFYIHLPYYEDVLEWIQNCTRNNEADAIEDLMEELRQLYQHSHTFKQCLREIELCNTNPSTKTVTATDIDRLEEKLSESVLDQGSGWFW